jgi:hypothetical protein
MAVEEQPAIQQQLVMPLHLGVDIFSSYLQIPFVVRANLPNKFRQNVLVL